MRGLSLVAASGGHSSSRCTGLALSRPLLLRSTGSRCAGSVVVAHGPSCSAACGIFPDQSSNPCPLHWQADSQPLRHQGSPSTFSLILSLEDLVELCYSHLYVFDIYIKFSCKIISSNILSTLLISFQQCLIYYLGYLLSIILTNLFLNLKISILILFKSA